MKVVLMLDDEHYTQPCIIFCETEEEGFDLFESWNAETEGTYTVEGNRCTWERGYNFAVCEVYDLSEKPYILIHWHAYEGVGFDVKQFDSFEEANATMRSEAEDILIRDEVENYPVTDEDCGAVIDDGYEWNCWKIIEKGEKDV